VIASAWWLWLSIGLFVGAALGILVAALMAAAAQSDRTSERIYEALERTDEDVPDIGIEHRPRKDEE